MTIISRRGILQGAGGLAAAGALSGIGRPLLAQEAQVRWAELTPGFTVLVTHFIRHHRLDEANGFRLGTATEYTSVPTYYSDFDVGNYDICIGSWDTFAVRHAGGVPLKYVCNITTANMIHLISLRDTGVDTLADLAGKVLAAPQSTGTYRMTKAVLTEFEGIDVEGSSTIQNVNNPAGSVSVLRAGSASAGLTWEPNISNGIAEDARIQSIYNVGEAYTAGSGGGVLPYFGVAVRSELLDRDPEVGTKIDAMFRACIEGIVGDVDAAVNIVGESTGFRPDVLAEAISSGRLDFRYASMAEEDARNNLRAAAEFCVRNGALASVPDDSFFIGA